MAIPVVLFALLIQTQPRRIDLGTFKSSVVGRQKAFQALTAESRRHPLSRQIEVKWETKFPHEVKIGIYETKSRTSSLRYEPLRKDLYGKYWVTDKTSPIGGYSFGISCSRISSESLNALLKDGADDNSAEWNPSRKWGCSTMGDTTVGN